MFDTSYGFTKIRKWRYVWYEDLEETDANIITFEPTNYPDNTTWIIEWFMYSKEGDSWVKDQKSIVDTNRFFGTIIKCTEDFLDNNTEYSRLECGPATTQEIYDINCNMVDKVVSTRNNLQKELDSDRLTVYINVVQ